MLSRTLALVGTLALVLAPLSFVGAQNGSGTETSTVTFYGHVFGHGLGSGVSNNGPMPANTEAPVGEDNYGFGAFDWCTPVANLEGLPPGPSTTAGCDDDVNNKLALFSTAGFVDVSNVAEFNSEGGYALLHNERGQTKDVLLDTSQSITATIFQSLDVHGWPAGGDAYGSSCTYAHPPDVPCIYPYWGWDPGVQPDYVVKATLYSANLGAHGANASDMPPIEEAVQSGDATIIAEGQWGPEQVMNGLPGSPNVNEFVIDLGPPQVDKVPKSHDFFIVYSFYEETAGNKYGVHTWRIWAGEFFPPTFTLPVKNAFDVERVIPNFAHGKLAILGVMNTPWGSYDIDGESVELTIEGPSGEITPEHISRFGDVSFAHGGHYLPINLTWIWDYQKEGLQPGEYTVTVSAQNFQHSASGTCSATFELKTTGSGQLSPGKVQEGECGLQSASDEFLEDIKEGSTQEGGN